MAVSRHAIAPRASGARLSRSAHHGLVLRQLCAARNRSVRAGTVHLHAEPRRLFSPLAWENACDDDLISSTPPRLRVPTSCASTAQWTVLKLRQHFARDFE